jgi:hypothetical protein
MPNTDSAGSETDSAGGGTAPSAPTGSNTDTPQTPDTGTDKVVDGITYDVFKDNSDATLAELWVDQDIDVAGITADIL